MIVPDINLIVYAYTEDAPFHDASKTWWQQCLSENEPVGLAWAVILGFVRLMSNRRILARPMAASEAVQQRNSWLAQPNVRIVVPGSTHLDILAELLGGPVGPNLVTDAHLAVLAIEHQAELHSNDSDSDATAVAVDSTAVGRAHAGNRQPAPARCHAAR